MTVFTESGINDKWWENGRKSAQKTGQRNAKQFAEDKSYYLGLDQSGKDASEETREMFLQLAAFGIIVATAGFLFEWLYYVVLKFMCNPPDQVFEYTH